MIVRRPTGRKPGGAIAGLRGFIPALHYRSERGFTSSEVPPTLRSQTGFGFVPTTTNNWP
jgi:hypothetical protein